MHGAVGWEMPAYIMFRRERDARLLTSYGEHFRFVPEEKAQTSLFANNTSRLQSSSDEDYNGGESLRLTTSFARTEKTEYPLFSLWTYR